MKRSIVRIGLGAALIVGVASAAFAGFPKTRLKKCAGDAVVAGTACVDKYEVSVWRTVDRKTIKKIQKGKITGASQLATVAIQEGAASDTYGGAGCLDTGTGCGDYYAVSIPGVTPSAYITWFQAQEACANSGKRLPTNAEWQVAANGTPDTGGADNGTTDCNTDNLAPGVTATGARSGCVAARGAFDMVGNLWEWVADWVPQSTACPGWGLFSDDYMCLSGASTTATGPGALVRGGGFLSGEVAGPLSVSGGEPSSSLFRIGFRCAR